MMPTCLFDLIIRGLVDADIRNNHQRAFLVFRRDMMSIPIKPKQLFVSIKLTATESENLALFITQMLERARQAQEENPGIHWETEEVMEHRLYPSYRLSENLEVHVFPDKRHKGCSGYCHY